VVYTSILLLFLGLLKAETNVTVSADLVFVSNANNFVVQIMLYVRGKMVHQLFVAIIAGWRCGVHADWTSLHECVPQCFEQTIPPRKYGSMS